MRECSACMGGSLWVDMGVHYGWIWVFTMGGYGWIWVFTMGGYECSLWVDVRMFMRVFTVSGCESVHCDVGGYERAYNMGRCMSVHD